MFFFIVSCFESTVGFPLIIALSFTEIIVLPGRRMPLDGLVEAARGHPPPIEVPWLGAAADRCLQLMNG